MIDGAWPYVWASYALTAFVVAGLVIAVALRLRHWSRRARALTAPTERSR
jgi:heme exporter protein CcmD